MSTDEDALLAALAGGGDGTLVDQLDDALSVAWRLASGLNLTLPTSGGLPGPYRPGGTSWDLAYDQTCARWGAAPKARTFAEKAALLEQLVRGIDAHRATPTPGGTLPAGTTQGTLTWHADFTKADVVSAGFLSTNWNTQSGPSWPPPIVTAPDRPAEKCIKFALPAGGERIEVQPSAAQSIGNGQDCWYGFWFIADASFVSKTDDWHIVCQFHGADTTSPHQIIAINGGDLLTGNAPQHHFATGQIKAGVRYNLVTHVTANSGGRQSVWLNDVLVLDNFAAGLNATPLYLKCGIYQRPGTFPASTIYQGQHRIGSGYGAVRPT